MLNFISIKDVKIELGKWCKSLRKARKMSQIELAAELNISPLTIAKLEKGDNPTLETILKVLQYFDEMASLYNFISAEQDKLSNTPSMY